MSETLFCVYTTGTDTAVATIPPPIIVPMTIFDINDNPFAAGVVFATILEVRIGFSV
jgi:hypothetical protein